MPKDILLYGDIYSYTAERFINALSDVDGEDIKARINSNGGSPEYAWGMIGKFAEHSGGKTVHVDGQARSMAAFFLVYADDAECYDVSQFLLHRAHYPEWMESSMSESMQEDLTNVNAKLRKACESKFSSADLKRVTGYTMNQLFSTDGVQDIVLTAEQAKDLGLVSKVNKLTPSKKRAIADEMVKVAEHSTGMRLAAKADDPAPQPEPEKEPISKSDKMTLAELQAKHPELYAKAVETGVNQERDRVGSLMAFVDVDTEAVSKMIKDGEELSKTAMADFTRKMFSKEAKAEVQSDSQGKVDTDEPENPETDADKKALADFEKEVMPTAKAD